MIKILINLMLLIANNIGINKNYISKARKNASFYYVLTQRTMRSIVQKPRAKRVRLGLKYKQHLLEYNSEVQATKILKKGVVYGTKFIT